MEVSLTLKSFFFFFGAIISFSDAGDNGCKIPEIGIATAKGKVVLVPEDSNQCMVANMTVSILQGSFLCFRTLYVCCTSGALLKRVRG